MNLEQAIEQVRKLVETEQRIADRAKDDDTHDQNVIDFHHARATTSMPAILAAMVEAKAAIEAAAQIMDRLKYPDTALAFREAIAAQ